MGTRIPICGSVVVQVDGRRIDGELPGRQGRLLLVYLAANRDRAVTRDELMEALWPRELPTRPDSALSALLSKLRSVLGAASIEGKSELRHPRQYGLRSAGGPDRGPRGARRGPFPP